MKDIHKVAVFGAGVMGAGIAAQVANAGIPVLLFDVASSNGKARNAIAASAIDKLLKTDPAPLMHPRNAELITPLNISDDMHRIADCDWIVEAIVERLDAKRALYNEIDAARRPGSVVSSNTSTIRLSELVETLPASFAADFLITHFFNPPRYLRLLEIVPGPWTRPEAIAKVERFADILLGKTPVRCKDTPGFIANRIGIYWLQCAVLTAIDQGLTIEETDAVLGRPMGAPKTGVFGLLDMVGLDLMPHVLGNMKTSLPERDPFHAVYRESELIKKMIAEGYTGRKGKGGFYRLKPDSKEKIKESLDLATGTYRPSRKVSLQSVDKAKSGGLKSLLEHPDKGGRYAWSVLSRTLSYAAALVPEIADDIVSVDEAMKLGYNWKYGPFELIDRLGPDWFAQKLRAEGMPVPPMLAKAEGRRFYHTQNGQLQYLSVDGEYRNVVRPEGVLLLSDIKRRSRPLSHNPSASLWDVGDGVLCLEFHSKMNSIDPLIIWMVNKAVKTIPGKYRALVIYNEGGDFSVGANIGWLLAAMKLHAWAPLRGFLRWGQNAYMRLKYAPFPVVGAPSGMALGGGCEALLHCDAIQAHAETYMGLVEAGVGIVPGWGGCKELLVRRAAAKQPPFGPMPPVVKAFEAIGLANVAKSAEQAKDLLFLRPHDGITMNRDRLLADAKAKALALAENYKPPEPPRLSLPGKTGFAALSMAVDGFRRQGKATPHDAIVGKELARVLSGGDTDITESLGEADVLALERAAILNLAKQRASQERVAHMIKTGKSLRN